MAAPFASSSTPWAPTDATASTATADTTDTTMSPPEQAAAEPASAAPERTSIHAFSLSNAAHNLVCALAESVQQDIQVLLAAKALGEARNWSTAALSWESWMILAALQEQLAVCEGEALLQAVSVVNPSAVYMSQNALVVQTAKGLTHVEGFLTTEEDCGLMIPLIVPEAPDVSALDLRAGFDSEPLRLQLTPEASSPAPALGAFVVSGTSSIRVASPDPVFWVVFCLEVGEGT